MPDSLVLMKPGSAAWLEACFATMVAWPLVRIDNTCKVTLQPLPTGHTTEDVPGRGCE
jgi:hypothetical protein